jgi:hypothetical protein
VAAQQKLEVEELHREILQRSRQIEMQCSQVFQDLLNVDKITPVIHMNSKES